MSTATAVPPATPSAEPPRRLWTREEYHRAGELGLFRPDEKLELIEGEIIQKVSPQNTPHTTAILLTAKALESVFGAGYDVRYQMPLVATDISEPEPDVLVLLGTTRDYEDHQPTAKEVLLVVEVSDSTLAYDRGTKARLYAKAGVAEYWIINLVQRRVEAYRQPLADGTYRNIVVSEEKDSVSPLGAPGSSVPVLELLPTRR